jgi:hypothetical protein
MQAQDFTQSPMDPSPRRLRGMYDDQGMLASALGGYQ